MPTSTKSLLLLLISSYLLTLVSANNLFSGCYSWLPATFTIMADQSSATSCMATCSNQATTFTQSYFNATSTQCFCSNTPPARTILASGTKDACGRNWDTRLLRASYVESSPLCYSTIPSGISWSNTAGLNACLKECGDTQTAIFWANTASNSGHSCSCDTPSRYTRPAGTCSQDTYYAYNRPAIPAVAAENLFTGCHTWLPTTFVQSADQLSATACLGACLTGATPYTHSYFNSTSTQCFCSSATPPQARLTTGSRDNCDNEWDIRLGRSSFRENQSSLCYRNIPTGVTGQRSTSSVAACLTQCAGSRTAVFWGSTNAGIYSCGCTNSPTFTNPTTCGPQTFFAYSHTAEAAASQLTKRTRREKIAQEKAAKARLFCPLGSTACMIKGFEGDTYECIDTQSELESCGGCMSGQYGLPGARPGQDCSNMRHAAKGGTTCMEGRCVAFACKRGFVSIDGECVKGKASR